jgi:hypothetical protein
VDASSFQKCDDQDSEYAKDPIAYVGAELARHGYARHGQEIMINGFTGEEMPCDIFIGLVYYQRLRHMVKDKFQVCCKKRVSRMSYSCFVVASSSTRHVLLSRYLAGDTCTVPGILQILPKRYVGPPTYSTVRTGTNYVDLLCGGAVGCETASLGRRVGACRFGSVLRSGIVSCRP